MVWYYTKFLKYEYLLSSNDDHDTGKCAMSSLLSVHMESCITHLVESSVDLRCVSVNSLALVLALLTSLRSLYVAFQTRWGWFGVYDVLRYDKVDLNDTSLSTVSFQWEVTAYLTAYYQLSLVPLDMFSNRGGNLYFLSSLWCKYLSSVCCIRPFHTLHGLGISMRKNNGSFWFCNFSRMFSHDFLSCDDPAV